MKIIEDIELKTRQLLLEYIKELHKFVKYGRTPIIKEEVT